MAKQDEQISLARSEASRAKALAYQAALLNVVATFTAEFRHDANENLAAAEQAMVGRISALEGVRADHTYRVKADESRKKIAALTLLALELSVNEFNDINEIRAKFVPEMLNILNL
jgi:hypothetical protein